MDPGEHSSGVVQEPGICAAPRMGHLMTRAIRHGVAGSRLEDLEKPCAGSDTSQLSLLAL